MQTAALVRPPMPPANHVQSIQQQYDQENFGKTYRLLTSTETQTSMTPEGVLAFEALYPPKTLFLPM
jgi:hypothetical protein